MLRDIRKDALVVEVAHPGWLQAVILRKKVILKRINGLYPGIGIKEIKVRIVKKPAPRVVFSGKRGLPASEVPEKQPDTGEIEELLSCLSENELKKALKKLYTAHTKRRSRRN